MYSMHGFGGLLGFLLILRVMMVLLLPILAIVVVIYIFTHKKKPTENKPSNTSFKDRLKYYREAKGSSIEDVSEALQLTPSVYNRFETGQLEPHLDDLIKLASYFEVSCDQLLKDGISLTQLVMHVDDVEAAKSFFETYFKAKSKPVSDHYLVCFDDGCCLELMHQENPMTSHIVLRVGSKQALADIVSKLQEDGYAIDTEDDRAMSTFSGNLIEIRV